MNVLLFSAIVKQVNISRLNGTGSRNDIIEFSSTNTDTHDLHSYKILVKFLIITSAYIYSQIKFQIKLTNGMTEQTVHRKRRSKMIMNIQREINHLPNSQPAVQIQEMILNSLMRIRLISRQAHLLANLRWLNFQLVL